MSGIAGVYLLTASENGSSDLDLAAPMASQLINVYSGNIETSYRDNRLCICELQPPSFDDQFPLITKDNRSDLFALVDGRMYLDEDNGFVENPSRHIIQKYGQSLAQRCEVDEDGEYIVVCYDKSNSRLTIRSDYFGHRFLYFYKNETALFFATDISALLAIPRIPKAFKTKSVVSFFEDGVLSENDTWFEEIKLISPGEISEFDGENAWSYQRKNIFSDIKEDASLAFDGAVSRAGELFGRAVAKRLPNNDKNYEIAVQLSGGLDSRAILGALLNYKQKITAFTFGKKESFDFRIASHLTRKMELPHVKTVMEPRKWFRGRLKAVWDTGGQLDLRHMHGIIDNDQYKNCDLHFSGVLGGAIIGGFFEGKYASHPMDVVRYRLRRFSGQSIALSTNYIEQRMPFYDIELNRFLLSLPKKYLQDSKLYHKMLMRLNIDLFRWVPWQHTMLPITASPKLHKFSRKIITLILGLQRRLSVSILEWRMSNEELWARQEPVRSLIEERLLCEQPLFSKYIDKVLSQNKINAYLRGDNRLINFVLRLLTVEIWLASVERCGPVDEPKRIES